MENLGNEAKNIMGSILTAGLLSVAIPNANAEAPNNDIKLTVAQVKKECQDGLTCAQTEIQLASLDHENENTDPQYIRYYKLKEKGAFKELFAENSEHEKTIIAYIDSVDEEIQKKQKFIERMKKRAEKAEKEGKIKRKDASLRAIDKTIKKIEEYRTSIYILSELPIKHQIDAMEIFGLIPDGKGKGYHKKITVDFLKIADDNVYTKEQLLNRNTLQRILSDIEPNNTKIASILQRIVDEEVLESEKRAKRSKENREFIENLYNALKG